MSMRRICCVLTLALSFAVAGAALAAKPDPRVREASDKAMAGFTEHLKKLVSMDSGTDDIAGLNVKKDYLVAALKKAGAEVTVLDAAGPRSGTSNLIAQLKGKGKAKIMIICHYDTVWSAGEAAKRPFRIENNIAYGPGVADAQHSVAGLLTLFEIMRSLKYDEFAVLTLVLNADEEKGSIGSKDLIVQQAARHDVVFSMEDGGEAGDTVLISCRGNNNAVITVKGRAAHSGENPTAGRNAGVELSRQILNMLDLSDTEKYTDANWTLGSFGSKANIIPDTATATLNVRTALTVEADRVEAEMLKRIKNVTDPDCSVSLDFKRVRPPFEFTEKTDTLAKAAEVIFMNEVGRTLKRDRMGGASDANFACQKAPVLEGLGMGGGNWHAPTEFLPLGTVPDRLYLLTRMVQETSRGNTVPIGTPDR